MYKLLLAPALTVLGAFYGARFVLALFSHPIVHWNRVANRHWPVVGKALAFPFPAGTFDIIIRRRRCRIEQCNRFVRLINQLNP